VSRVRNATEFLRLLLRARDDYRTIYRRLIEDIRTQFARNPSGQVPPDIDESLEAHMRVYFVNVFLNALNWRMELSPQNGLPNLIPEAPIESSSAGSTRFLDYLGLEGGGGRPLLIVETKRPSSKLPRKRTKDAIRKAICDGLTRANLGREWNEWLGTLQDYVRSVHDRFDHVPQRVVITNGRWLIIFTDPADSFLESGSRSSENVLIYDEGDDGRPDEIEDKFEDIFKELEYQRVLGRTPPLTSGQVAFHLRPDIIDRVMHGLRLKYREDERLYSVSPIIHVSPVLFLRSRFGTWVLVESRVEEPIPDSVEELFNHLDRIKRIAAELLADINQRLGTALVCATLESHYADEESFEALNLLTGGRHGDLSHRSQDFLLVTGANTHYLLKEPTVTGCVHHSWVDSRASGCEFGSAPLLTRSTKPPAFFISGQTHHCAHREVAAAKASAITDENRMRCGPRAGRNSEAFCEIWHFEQHLCCRTCAFEEVCTKAQVFTLPCRRPTLEI
jgi:hypothetical protein